MPHSNCPKLYAGRNATSIAHKCEAPVVKLGEWQSTSIRATLEVEVPVDEVPGFRQATT